MRLHGLGQVDAAEQHRGEADGTLEPEQGGELRQVPVDEQVRRPAVCRARAMLLAVLVLPRSALSW